MGTTIETITVTRPMKVRSLSQSESFSSKEIKQKGQPVLLRCMIHLSSKVPVLQPRKYHFVGLTFQ